MENAITTLHADVISQSYGSGGGGTTLWAADDAAVQAGVTVVASSGDEGFDNTFITPADDPDVIGVGASTDMRLLAQAYGYSGWTDDNIATLSSTGVGQPFSMPTAPGKLVDLVAPGYGGEAACSPLVTSSLPDQRADRGVRWHQPVGPVRRRRRRRRDPGLLRHPRRNAADAGAGPADPGRHRA